MFSIADPCKLIRRSENPNKDFLYTPSILRLDCGRLLCSLDISDRQGEIWSSDDGGESWSLKAERLFHHARLFADGDTIYLLGHYGDLVIFVSHDGGDSWSEGSFLTHGESWHQSACSVWYRDGYIYLVMELAIKDPGEDFPYWVPNILAPVVMRGKLGTDLSCRENWLFSERVRFRDLLPHEDLLEWFGVPFFTTAMKKPTGDGTTDTGTYKRKFDHETAKPGVNFYCEPMGWLETNVVQITDPRHYWYDPTGKTFHLFMRGHTAGSGYCCLAKAVERVVDGKETITIELEKVPSGKKMLFLPMPGGQMKFYIQYDPITKLYWLLSTQATDTMCRIECLPDDRYNIPCDERARLVLHYSKNMVDWVFAGLIDKGDSSKQARHYGSMTIDGNDLLVVSRSGDANCLNAHCGNIITFHRVKNFRELVY